MLEGSVVRSLKQAWADATYRFHSRTNDRYYDFGTDDARRLILLGALTFNRDFTGELLGLEMPWERPSNAQAKFEGRADLWLIMTAGEYAESTLIRVLQVALEHYAQCERTTPSIRPDLRAWQAPNRSGRRVEIKEDLIRRHRKGEEYLNQAAYARQYRCSPATVNKAFKDDVGLTAWMKLAVESRRSNSSPAKTSGCMSNMAQSREPDPADVAADDEVMERLCKEAGEGAREHIRGMPAANRRELISLINDQKTDRR